MSQSTDEWGALGTPPSTPTAALVKRGKAVESLVEYIARAQSQGTAAQAGEILMRQQIRSRVERVVSLHGSAQADPANKEVVAISRLLARIVYSDQQLTNEQLQTVLAAEVGAIRQAKEAWVQARFKQLFGTDASPDDPHGWRSELFQTLVTLLSGRAWPQRAGQALPGVFSSNIHSAGRLKCVCMSRRHRCEQRAEEEAAQRS